MNEPKQPARMGRPPRFPDEGPRTNHSVRLKPSISQALREAAEKNNRSLAEEMEHRINMSFEDGNSDNQIIIKNLNRSIVEKEQDIESARLRTLIKQSKLVSEAASAEIFALSMMRSHFQTQNDVFTKMMNYVRSKFGAFVDTQAHFVEFSIEKIDREIEAERERYRSAQHDITNAKVNYYKHIGKTQSNWNAIVEEEIENTNMTIWQKILSFPDTRGGSRSK